VPPARRPVCSSPCRSSQRCASRTPRGSARYFAGFEAGQTKLTARFVLTDAQTKEEVLRFHQQGTFKGALSAFGGNQDDAYTGAARGLMNAMINQLFKEPVVPGAVSWRPDLVVRAEHASPITSEHEARPRDVVTSQARREADAAGDVPRPSRSRSDGTFRTGVRRER